MNDYFERVEAKILLEQKANQQKLLAYYQKLVEDVHESKGKCIAAPEDKQATGKRSECNQANTDRSREKVEE